MTLSDQQSLRLRTAVDRAGRESTMGRVSTILVDGHVHLHLNFDLAGVLDRAAANCRTYARRLGVNNRICGCLLLAEAAGVNRFEELAGSAGQCLGRWSIRAEQWPSAIVASCAGEPALAVIAGRQVVTREKLEVILVGCRHAFGEGDAFENVVSHAIAESRFCVVPWGFGKWTGDRGQLVKQLMLSPAGQRIYLGDNGGRLRWGPRPELFTLAQQHGIPVLPGTDPFPFPSHASRIGSYGFVVRGHVDPDNIGAGVVDLIVENRSQFAGYGHRSGVVKFIYNQVAIQVRNRLLRPS